jgi:phosphopantothenoylcysteine decarboxylase / phosphopantothenate---cysteine ligase
MSKVVEPSLRSLRGLRVLLGVTGGIAAYKAAYLIRLLRKAEAEVVVTMTDSASHFIGPATLETLSGNPVVRSLWEPALPREISHVEHIGLVKWADFALMAPATMNSLGKLARGLADDALSTIFAAFEPERVLLAPAMNTGMWENPATSENVEALKARGYSILGPGRGELACGDVDTGRMLEPEQLVIALAEKAEQPPGLLAGHRILVSAGPTREALDPVRYLTNPSTGTMGRSIALAAWREGAEVIFVAGPEVAATPGTIARYDVVSAAEMTRVILEQAQTVDLTVMAAAVSDFRPAKYISEKVKKMDASMDLELEPTVDILGAMRDRRLGGYRVGFAMETGNAEARGAEKLKNKGLDLIVVNDLNEEGAGFGKDGNRVTVLGLSGFNREYPLMDKDELGRELVLLFAERAFGLSREAGRG